MTTNDITHLPPLKNYRWASDMLLEQAKFAGIRPEDYETCIVLHCPKGKLANWAIFGDTTVSKIIGFIEMAKHEMIDSQK